MMPSNYNSAQQSWESPKHDYGVNQRAQREADRLPDQPKVQGFDYGSPSVQGQKPLNVALTKDTIGNASLANADHGSQQ